MAQFTIISNSSNYVLYIDIHNINEWRVIVELIHGKPNGDRVRSIQIVTQEFKDRLQILDKFGERLYQMKIFFNEMPMGHHYLFLQGHIDDCIQIIRHRTDLANLDNIPLKFAKLENIPLFLREHYMVLHFNGNNKERIKIGVYDKSKRVCRFCGLSMPDVTFKQTAHAISESLGNKKIICYEECDDCNQRFNRTIEQDIIRFFQPQLILHGIRGKNGSPTLQGKGISIKNKPSSEENGGTIIVTMDSIPNIQNIHELAQFASNQFSHFNFEFIPQNIYKCLCKYALSIIDNKYLTYFKETVNWINEPLSSHQLPPVWYYNSPLYNKAPSVTIMLRKHRSIELPYCWGIFNIAGYNYLFIMPFCSQDEFDFTESAHIQSFMEGVKSIMPNVMLQLLELQSISHQKLKMNLNLNIPPECIEGRDYIINPQELPEL